MASEVRAHNHNANVRRSIRSRYRLQEEGGKARRRVLVYSGNLN